MAHLTNSGDLPHPHWPKLAASTLKSHVCNAPRWTLALPQGAESVPDDAGTARGHCGDPRRGSPSPPPPPPSPGVRGVGRLWSTSWGEVSLGLRLRTWGGGWRKEAGCRSTCTDPLLLCPSAGPGGGGPLLLPQWGGECSWLPRWRSSLATEWPEGEGEGGPLGSRSRAHAEVPGE